MFICRLMNGNTFLGNYVVSADIFTWWTKNKQSSNDNNQHFVRERKAAANGDTFNTNFLIENNNNNISCSLYYICFIGNTFCICQKSNLLLQVLWTFLSDFEHVETDIFTLFLHQIYQSKSPWLEHICKSIQKGQICGEMVNSYSVDRFFHLSFGCAELCCSYRYFDKGL